MSQQKINKEQATECAACGGPIIRPMGRWKEFCSEECKRLGRAFCKRCKTPLKQNSKAQRVFCSKICQRIYYRVGSSLAYLEESRSSCKACGHPITQNTTGGRRQFCSQRCGDKYRYFHGRGLNLKEKWGTFGPTVREVIRDVEEFMGIGTAKRLATAIDREYNLRLAGKEIRSAYATHLCKTCNKEFRRRPWGHQSVEYCSPKCLPNRHRAKGSSTRVRLTQEQVDEIRRLYATGDISLSAIGKMYGVDKTNISSIVNYHSWRSHGDTKVDKPQRRTKLTWEQVDEIRRLHLGGGVTQIALADKYNVSNSLIWRVITYRVYKPERDPRRKGQER